MVPVSSDSTSSVMNTQFLNTFACPPLNLYLQPSSVLGLGRSPPPLLTTGWLAFTCGMITMAHHGMVIISFVVPRRLFQNTFPNHLVALVAPLSQSSTCIHFFNASTCQIPLTLLFFASRLLHSGLVAGNVSLLQFNASQSNRFADSANFFSTLSMLVTLRVMLSGPHHFAIAIRLTASHSPSFTSHGRRPHSLLARISSSRSSTILLILSLRSNTILQPTPHFLLKHHFSHSRLLKVVGLP